MDRSRLPTEVLHPLGVSLETLDAAAAVAAMQAVDREAFEAVEGAQEAIAEVLDLCVSRLTAGGRLLYLGAGTSGRLGALDAAECPPTFRSSPTQVQGILAGGPGAMLHAVEGAEDDAEGARAALEDLNVGPKDVVLGIAAGGTTPYVHGALAIAKEHGATTVFLACVPRESVPDEADHTIRLKTGPEILAGSTRLKAGTATKLVLNTLSTLTMVRLGKSYAGWMVDVAAQANAKLWRRAIAIVQQVCSVGPEQAEALLQQTDGEVKTAILCAKRGLDARAARRALVEAGGHLRLALGPNS